MGHENRVFACSQKHTENESEKLPKTKPKSLQTRVWRLPKKGSENGRGQRVKCLKMPSEMDPKIDEQTMQNRTWAPWGRRVSFVRSRKALGIPPPTNIHRKQPKNDVESNAQQENKSNDAARNPTLRGGLGEAHLD